MKPGIKRNSGPASQRAFSLLELLVVGCILLILGGLYFSPSGNRQARLMAQCQSNLQGLYMALEIYSREHDGQFPVSASASTAGEALEVLVPRYTSEVKFFTCPATGRSQLDPGKPLGKQRISYSYFMGQSITNPGPIVSDALRVQTPPSHGELVFSPDGKPPGNNHQKRGGNFLFTDGSVQASTPVLELFLTNTAFVILLNPRR